MFAILSCFMPSRTLAIISAAAALALAATPSVAAAAPVDVAEFTLTPSCVRPGGQVTAHVGLRNTTLGTQSAYAQAWATVGLAEVYTSPAEGPYPVPPLATLGQDKAIAIDQWTPPGFYEVHVGVGPSATSPRSWSQRSAWLTVSHFFC
jgi:hypothetical protein